MSALQLVTNLYPITVSSGPAKVYTYDVRISPAPAHFKVVDRLIGRACREFRAVLGPTISTGQSVFATKQVTDDDQLRVTIKYRPKQRREAAASPPPPSDLPFEEFEVALHLTGGFDMAQAEAKKVFVNTFIDRRVLPKLGLEPLGNAFIDPKSEVSLSRVKVWSGLSTAADVFASKVAMRLDICHKVLRPETALDLLRQSATHRSPSSTGSRDFENEVVGRVVMTRYNQRTYRVKKVLWDENPLTTFRKRDRRLGKGADADLQADAAGGAAAAASSVPRAGAGAGTVMTFREYFQQQYNITLQDDTQPLLLVEARRGARRVKLPAELCTLTGLSDAMRADFNLMRDMTRTTSVRSEERVRRADEWARRIAAQLREPALAEWGVAMEAQAVTVPGLVGPPLHYTMFKHGQPAAVEVPTDGKELGFRDLGVEDRNWGDRPWTVVYGGRDERDVMEFLKKLHRVSQELGITNMPVPTLHKLTTGDARDYEQFAREASPTQALYLCVLFNDRARCGYSRLKKILYTEMGVPCQCVTMKNVQSGNDTMLKKLMIQMLAKRGLKSYYVKPPPALVAEPTLVMGLDLEELEPRNRSHVIALTCTRDIHLALYLSELGYAPTGRDVPAVIASLIAKTCVRFRAGMTVAPKRIVLYRSGVSEGQLKSIKETELRAIERAVSDALGFLPEITLIVVQKSGSIRFAQTRTMGNPPPGTLVTQGVTVTEPYADFYLVSYAPKRIGEASAAAVPTRYVVIQLAAGGITKQDLLLLTYQQCAMYTNYSAGVRVPAPVALASRFIKMAVENFFRGYRPESGPPPVPREVEQLFLTQYYI